MKFKVGDRVRYLGGKNDRWITPGDTGKILMIGIYDFLCVWDNHKPNHNEWYANVNELELEIKFVNEQKLKQALGLGEK